MCYLCGQQFGNASIGIHIPQCYTKKVAQWEVGDRASRGAKPKHPDEVNWKGSRGESTQKLNEDQYQEYTANLVPCPHCARTFLPDRLPVHLRGCSKTAAVARPGSKGFGGAGGGSSGRESESSGASGGRAQSRAGSRPRRPPGSTPLLPSCYLCGQQFGNASIAIHVPQCYVKRLAQWEAGDPATRGKRPKHPDEANWKPVKADGSAMSAQEQADAQFQEFASNLEPCPNCGRKFLADRLTVHLRSCKPGNAAKRPGQTAPRTAAGASDDGESGGERERLTPRPPSEGPKGGRVRPAARVQIRDPASDPEPEPEPCDDLDRVHPKKNRLPKSARSCAQCGAAETDASAKFCRECGCNFNSRTMPDPCSRCGETVTADSRYCGTCGGPVGREDAQERAAGGENVNAPSVRMASCPACRAVCDADCNFCDNCGAALGATEPSSSSAAPSSSAGATPARYMFCAECKVSVDDLASVYCEDCGERLQLMERTDKEAAGPAGTLRPDGASQGKSASASPDSDNRSRSASPAAKAPNLPAAAKKAPSSASVVDDRGFQGMEEAGDVYREECHGCGRRFAPEALARHAKVCAGKEKVRAVFNMTKQRLADCDMPPAAKSGKGLPPPKSRGAAAAQRAGSQSAAVAPPKKDWRAESAAFRQVMRSSRQVDKVLQAGGNARDLPPPTYSENAHYTPCPHCNRKFASDVAERHIPRCATTVNRPKPPPRRR